jgi:hypothetical protein
MRRQITLNSCGPRVNYSVLVKNIAAFMVIGGSNNEQIITVHQ